VRLEWKQGETPRTDTYPLELCLAWDPASGRWSRHFGQSPPLPGRGGEGRLNAATYRLDCGSLKLADDVLEGTVDLAIDQEDTSAPFNGVGLGLTGSVDLSLRRQGGSWSGGFTCTVAGQTRKGTARVEEHPGIDPANPVGCSLVLEQALGPVYRPSPRWDHAGSPLRAVLDLRWEQGKAVEVRPFFQGGEGKVVRQELRFDGRCLTGTLTVTQPEVAGALPHFRDTVTLRLDCEVLGPVVSGRLWGRHLPAGDPKRDGNMFSYPGHVSGVLVPGAAAGDRATWSLRSRAGRPPEDVDDSPASRP
jgi:hypothetical protein